MAFFQNLFKPSAPQDQPVAASPAVAVLPVPQHLPRIAAPTAAQIAQTASPSPAAQQWLTPQQTPSQYLNVLQEKQMGDEMVKLLAHGLPDREGVWWAAQCAEKVSADLPPDDVMALQAALVWVKNPSQANQAAATAAAAKTDFRGPGAWAAQAASWAQPSTSPTTAGDATTAPRLTPDAVAAAVLLSSSIAANPKLASPKFNLPSVAMPNVAAPQLAAAGAGLAGVAVPGFAAPSLPAPSLNAPNLKTPSLSGAMPATPGMGGSNVAAPNLQSPSLTPPNLSLPQLSGLASGLAAPSLPNPSLTAPNVNAPGLNLSVPNLPAPQGSLSPSGASGMAVPNVAAPSVQMPGLDLPQIAPPTVPPAVKIKVFKDQYPCIALGIDIAAGKKNCA